MGGAAIAVGQRASSRAPASSGCCSLRARRGSRSPPPPCSAPVAPRRRPRDRRRRGARARALDGRVRRDRLVHPDPGLHAAGAGPGQARALPPDGAPAGGRAAARRDLGRAQDPHLRPRRRAARAARASAVVSLAVNYSSFTERLLGTEATKAATYLLTFPIVFVLVASGVRSRADVERCIKAIVVGGAVVAFAAIVETRTSYNVFNHLRTVFPFLQDTGERADRGAQRRAARRGLRAAPDRARRRARRSPAALARADACACKDMTRRIVFGACALLLVIGMVATISRTAFLALAVMLLVGLMTRAPPPAARCGRSRSCC